MIPQELKESELFEPYDSGSLSLPLKLMEEELICRRRVMAQIKELAREALKSRQGSRVGLAKKVLTLLP